MITLLCLTFFLTSKVSNCSLSQVLTGAERPLGLQPASPEGTAKNLPEQQPLPARAAVMTNCQVGTGPSHNQAFCAQSYKWAVGPPGKAQWRH